MGRVIAIDYGKKRVGLAVTDPLQLSSNILPFKPETKIKEWLLDYLETEEVETMIIGYPEHKSGNLTELTKDIDEFIFSILDSKVDLQVVKIEESFSSKDAVRYMINHGINKEKRKEKGLIDSYSALIMLQEYLQRKYL